MCYKMLRDPPSAVRRPRSAVRGPPSAVRRPRSVRFLSTPSDAKSPGFTGSLPVWNLTSRSPGERTKSPGIHVRPIMLSVINSENPKKI